LRSHVTQTSAWDTHTQQSTRSPPTPQTPRRTRARTEHVTAPPTAVHATGSVSQRLVNHPMFQLSSTHTRCVATPAPRRPPAARLPFDAATPLARASLSSLVSAPLLLHSSPTRAARARRLRQARPSISKPAPSVGRCARARSALVSPRPRAPTHAPLSRDALLTFWGGLPCRRRRRGRTVASGRGGQHMVLG